MMTPTSLPPFPHIPPLTLKLDCLKANSRHNILSFINISIRTFKGKESNGQWTNNLLYWKALQSLWLKGKFKFGGWDCHRSAPCMGLDDTRQVSHLVPEVWYHRAIKQIQYIPLPPPIKQHYEVTQLLWAISREIFLYVSIKGQLKNIFLMWCRTKWTCYKIFKKQLHYRRAQDLHLVQGCPPALARVIVSSPSLAALCPMDEHEPQMLQQL